MATTDQSAETGLFTQEGERVPLTGVSVSGDITGRGAVLTVAQTFANRESRPLEAVYRFPLPEGCAVCGFRAEVGGRIVEGGVEEYDRAFEIYDDAMARGDGAWLLDEERPNIFTLSVGNLMPGATARVTIRLVSLLEEGAEGLRFFLPATISPRYVPAGTDRVGDIPESDRVNPPLAAEVPYGLRLRLHIHGRDGISGVSSPSHGITVRFDADPVVVEFASGEAAMDRDFVLDIARPERAVTQGFLCRNGRGWFAQVDFRPGAEDAGTAGRGPGELVFLLDCSGSMAGHSIGEAKKAIGILLRGLEPGRFFNLYRFGSRFERLFPEPIETTPENLRRALERIEGIEADLGGTEILAPLREIYASGPPAGGGTRSLVIVTDGQVGNEDEILDLVREHRAGTRVFSVGIGYGPNEFFIRGIARRGRGAAEMVAPGERIEPRLLGLYRKMLSPGVEDLRIDGLALAVQAPERAVAFDGSTVSLFARMDVEPSPEQEIRVRGLCDGADRYWRVKLRRVEAGDQPVPLLWARERIRDLEERPEDAAVRGSLQVGRKQGRIRDEIVSISKEFGVLSRSTSFVAVEQRAPQERSTEGAELRKVPVMLTRGWGGTPPVASLQQSRPMLEAFQRPLIDYCLEADAACLEAEAAPPPVASVSRRAEAAQASFCFEESKHESRMPDAADLLLRILDSQAPEGGFEIDDGLAEELGMDADEIRRAASALGGEASRRLVETAIVLALLEQRFAGRRSTWEPLTKKSRDWFERACRCFGAEIHGRPIGQWARDFVAGLGG